MGRPRYGLNPRGRGVRYGFARKDPPGLAEASTMRSNYEPRTWHGHRLREELSSKTTNTAAHSPLAATPGVTVPVVLIMTLIAGLSCLLFLVFVFWRFWPDIRNYLNTSMNINGFPRVSEPQYMIFSPPPKDRKRYIPKCKLPADSGARTDTFTTCSEVVTVQVIPGDGDCLFAALAHQIFRRPVGSPEHASNTAMLRAEAVAYLRARAPSFRELLLSGVTFLGGRYADAPSDDDKIRRFLDDLARPGFWGGAECIAALANHLLMHVAIYPESGTMFVIKNATDEAVRVARIAYRLSKAGDGSYSHYDSVLSVQPGAP